jgi:hypothetical protein
MTTVEKYDDPGSLDLVLPVLTSQKLVIWHLRILCGVTCFWTRNPKHYWHSTHRLVIASKGLSGTLIEVECCIFSVAFADHKNDQCFSKCILLSFTSVKCLGNAYVFSLTSNHFADGTAERFSTCVSESNTNSPKLVWTTFCPNKLLLSVCMSLMLSFLPIWATYHL